MKQHPEKALEGHVPPPSTPEAPASINRGLADGLEGLKLPAEEAPVVAAPAESGKKPEAKPEKPAKPAKPAKAPESVDVPKTFLGIHQEVLIQYDGENVLHWRVGGFNTDTKKVLVYGGDKDNVNWEIRLVPIEDISRLNPGLVMPKAKSEKVEDDYVHIKYGKDLFDYKIFTIDKEGGYVVIGGVDNNGENPQISTVPYAELFALNPDLDIPQMRAFRPESEEKKSKEFISLEQLQVATSLAELIGMLKNSAGMKDGKLRLSSANLLSRIRNIQAGVTDIKTLPPQLQLIVEPLVKPLLAASEAEAPADELSLDTLPDALDAATGPIDFMPSESKKEPAAPEDKTPEVPEEITPEQSEVLERALATPGFDEFLANHPDAAFEANNPRQIMELFQAFQVREKVVTMAGQVATETFKDEIGLSNIDVRDSLRAYYDRVIYEDPRQIVRQAEDIAKAEKLNQEIVAAEAALKEKISALPAGSLMTPEEIEERRKIAKKIEFLGPADEKVREALQTTVKMLRKGQNWRAAIKLCAFDMPYALSQYTLTLLGYNSRERYQARQTIEAIHGDSSPESVDAYKKVTEQHKALSGKTAEVETQKMVAQETYAQRRKELAAQFLSSEKVIVAARAKIEDEMKKMLKSSTKMEDLMEVQKLLDRNVNAKIGADPKYLTPKSIEAFQKAIDEKARRIIDKHIEQTLSTPPKTKGVTFGAELDKTIDHYLKMDKIGSLEKKEIKRVLREALKIIMEKKDVSKLIKIRVGVLLLTNKLK